MLRSKTFLQERIANCAGKWHVNNPSSVNMPDFCTSESEFLPSEWVWVNPDTRPHGDFLFKFLQVVLHR